MKESNKKKRKRVFYYLIIIKKDVNVIILINLKDFFVRRFIINREV